MTDELIEGIPVQQILNEVDRLLEEHDLKTLSNSQRVATHLHLLNPRLKFKEMSAQVEERGWGRYSWTTLRTDLYEVRKRLSAALERSVRIQKAQLRRELLQLYRQRRSAISPEPSLSPLPAPLAGADSSVPVLRQEVHELASRIRQGLRGIISISGPPRIGKSTLVQALLERIGTHFERHFFCSAADVRTPEDLCQYLSNQGLAVPQGAPEQALLRLMRTSQLLIVIDKADILHESQQIAGVFAPASQGYEQWLGRLMDENRLQSCLIWISRAKPKLFERNSLRLLCSSLSGLGSDAVVKLLEQKAAQLPHRPAWEQLGELCGGHPELLLEVARGICSRPETSLKQFLRLPRYGSALDDIYWETLEHLSPKEVRLLLALLQLPFHQLQGWHLNVPVLNSQDRSETLSSLKRRGFLDRDLDGYFVLKPPVLERVLAQKLVRDCQQEIATGQISYLHQYPLVQSQAPAWRQQWQRCFVLAPLQEWFQHTYPTEAQQVACLQKLLQPLPEAFAGSYGASNVLTLAAAAEVPLARLDFSGLSIRQANLQWADLTGADARHCQFEESLLPVALQPPLTAALSPDGSLLTVGDNGGRLLCWRRMDTVFQLEKSTLLAASITALSCPEPDMVVVAAGSQVWEWWLEEVQPVPIMQASAVITSLAAQSNRYIAAGLITGEILLWNSRLYQQQGPFAAHTSRVQQLVFSSSGCLASVGRGNRVLLWRVDHETLTFDTEIPSTASVTFLQASWDEKGWQVADVSGSRILLQRDCGEPHEFTVQSARADAAVATVGFSSQGRYLIGLDETGYGCLWDLQEEQTQRCLQLPDQPVELRVSDDGRWLLSYAHSLQPQVQVWDTHHLRLAWSCESFSGAIEPRSNGSCQGLQLYGSHGLEAMTDLLIHGGATFARPS